MSKILATTTILLGMAFYALAVTYDKDGSGNIVRILTTEEHAAREAELINLIAFCDYQVVEFQTQIADLNNKISDTQAQKIQFQAELDSLNLAETK